MGRWILVLCLAFAGYFWSSSASASCTFNSPAYECTDPESAEYGAAHPTDLWETQEWCDANFPTAHTTHIRTYGGPVIPDPAYPWLDRYTAVEGCGWYNQYGDFLGYENTSTQWVDYYFPHGMYTPPFNPDRNRGPCAPKACFGDPINAGTGNKYEHVVEFRGVGAFPLELSWVYNSVGLSSLVPASDLMLGANRTHNYQRRIVVQTINGVKWANILRPNGNVARFKAGADITAWAPEVGADGQLLARLDYSLNPDPFIGWEYRSPERESEIYDANGVLLSISDSSGNTHTMVYDQAGRLSAVRDGFGRQLAFFYDANGRFDHAVLPDGGTVQFGYDADNNLASVVHAGGASTAYRYNEASLTSNTNLPHALTGEIDENGVRHSSTTYDAQGRATGTFLAGGVDAYSAIYTSSADGSYVKTAAITTPNGKLRTLQLRPVNLDGGRVMPTGYTDTCSGCTAATTSMVYDADGGSDGTTDASGVVTDDDRNSNGFLTQQVRAKGTPQQQTESYTWENSYIGQPTGIYRSGQTITITRNARHQALVTTITDTANNAARVTTRTYCEQAGLNAGTCPMLGLLLSVDGPRTDANDVTTYQYYSSDDPGCPVSCTHRKGDLLSVTNPLGQVTQNLAYDGAGRLLSMRDPNGVVTDMEYSPRGKMTASKVRGPDNGTEVDDAITRFQYDPAGQLTSITLPDGSVTIMVYDGAHRLTDVRDGLGNSIHYTLDNGGNRIGEDTRDAGNALRRNLTRLFNASGLVKTYADAQATPTDFTYDVNGKPDTTRDPLGRITDNDYDPLGRLKQQIFNSGGSGSERAVLKYAYDGRDNLLSVTDPNNLVTSYAYDGLDNKIRQVSPDTGTTTYTFDSAGNRRTALDARGKTTTYVWDALNRNTAQTVATSAQNVYFDYDQPQSDCQTGETFGAGRLARIRDESGSTRWCYDRRGNVLRKVQTVVGGTTLTVGASYSNANHLLALTYPSGAIVVYGRNSDGQIQNIGVVPKAGAAQVTLVSNISYLPYGPESSITFGNGRVLTKAYDTNYRIDKVSDSAATSPLSQDVGVDVAGNLTSIVEQTGATGVSRTFAYDGLDRLTSLKNGASTLEGYAYDSTGNRLSKTASGTTQAYSYTSGTDRLASVAGTARSYDANGNTTLIGTASKGTVLAYDDRNRLRDAKVANKSVATYRYNGRGERVLKTDLVTAANSRQFVYDEAGHLLGIYNTTTGARIQEFVWAEDTLVGVLSDHDGSTYQYVETDQLGTPRAIVHPAKNVIVWRWTQTGSAFGEHLPVEDADGNAVSYSLNLRFPGQFYDSETKLTYNRRRDYDATAGRFLESDPIGLAGGTSTYGYANGNPVKLSDPSGLRVEWQGIMTGASGGGVVVFGAYRFMVGSSCVNNKQAYADLFSAAVGLGLGFEIPGVGKAPDISGGGSNISLHDWTNLPDPETVHGTWGMAGMGVVAGAGAWGGWLRLGDAFSGFSGGASFGLDLGLQVVGGYTFMLDSKVTDCGCVTK